MTAVPRSGKSTPVVGQVWFDRDHRVSSRYVRVLAVLDDGRVHVARFEDGSGPKSKIQVKNLHRRFTLWKDVPA